MSGPGVTPDPGLYPKVPLVGSADDGRIQVYLTPMGLGDIRVFAWIPSNRADNESIPEQSHENFPGEYRIYQKGVTEDAMQEFNVIRYGVAAQPWSARFSWLEENGFTQV